jgi:hypothetical protein
MDMPDMHEEEGEGLVALDFACPRCGERRIDYLVCREDDLVDCQTCGATYNPQDK